MSTQQAAELIRSTHDLEPLARRIESVSRAFLHTPYVSSPLGEGPGHPPDEDPRFGLAGFDCTTFVETVLALSLADDLDDARRILDDIRYTDGVVGFATRKHLPMAQWIPENIGAGFFRDITAQVGGEATQTAGKRLDKETWQARRPEILPELDADHVPLGEHQLPFIPSEHIMARAQRIPSGTVVSVVRVDFRSMPIRVSHQGFLIRSHGKLVLRHAARTGHAEVADELFDTFVRRSSNYGKWPVVGFNLLQPRIPDALRTRRAAHAAGSEQKHRLD